MKPDLYTKAVLTVIAVCLVWISIGNVVFPRPVEAQNQNPTLVKVSGFTSDALSQLIMTSSPGLSQTGVPVVVVNSPIVRVSPK